MLLASAYKFDPTFVKNRFLLDSGSSVHLTCQRDLLTGFTKIDDHLILGDSSITPITGRGVIHALDGYGAEITFQCFYGPRTPNVISASQLIRQGFSLSGTRHEDVLSNAEKGISHHFTRARNGLAYIYLTPTIEPYEVHPPMAFPKSARVAAMDFDHEEQDSAEEPCAGLSDVETKKELVQNSSSLTHDDPGEGSTRRVLEEYSDYESDDDEASADYDPDAVIAPPSPVRFGVHGVGGMRKHSRSVSSSAGQGPQRLVVDLTIGDDEFSDSHVGEVQNKRNRSRYMNGMCSSIDTFSSPPHLSSSQLKSMLAHHRFGHVSLRVIQNTVRCIGVIERSRKPGDRHFGDSTTLSQDLKEISNCDSCLITKAKRVPFNIKRPPAECLKVGQELHTDITGPFFPVAFPGFSRYRHFLLDRKCYFLNMDLLKAKSDAEARIIFQMEQWHNITGRYPATLYRDAGGETSSVKFGIYLNSIGCVMHTAPTGHHQRNGTVEAAIGAINSMTRVLLHQSGLPLSCWGFAALHAVVISNMLVRPHHIASPYFMKFGRHPPYHLLHVFGARCYVMLPHPSVGKLGDRSVQGRYMGLDLDNNSHIVLTSPTTVTRSVHVRFDDSSALLPGPSNELFMKFDPPVRDTRVQPPVSPRVLHQQAIPPPVALPTRGVGVISPIEMLVPVTSERALTPPVDLAVNEAPPPMEEIPDSSQPSGADDDEVEVLPLRRSSRVPKYNHTRFHEFYHLSTGGFAEPKLDHPFHHDFYQLSQFSTSADALEELDDSPDFKLVGEQPVWKAAVAEELKGLVSSGTFTVEPASSLSAVEKSAAVSTVWKLRIKRDDKGAVTRHKARLVARGFEAKDNLTHRDRFSPTPMLYSMRLIMLLIYTLSIPCIQLDVKQAFLNSKIFETVYLVPPGFTIATCLVFWKLCRSLYGLAQSSHNWHVLLKSILCGPELRYKQSQNDQSVFFHPVTIAGGALSVVIVHVDDIICAGPSNDLDMIITVLQSKFGVTGSRCIKTYTGLTVSASSDGTSTFLSAQSYIQSLLKKFDATAAQARIPLVDEIAPRTDDEELQSVKYMQQVCGALQWISRLYRLDITFAVNEVCRHAHNPAERHITAATHILNYLNATPNFGLKIVKSPHLILSVYCDASLQRKGIHPAVGAIVVYINSTPIHWASKRQKRITLTVYDAELSAGLDAAKEALFFRRYLLELGVINPAPVIIYSDNDSVVKFAYRINRNEYDTRLDHKFFYIRQCVTDRLIDFVHVYSEENPSDLLTKPLQYPSFSYLREKLDLFPVA
jgi:hypothetical protein